MDWTEGYYTDLEYTFGYYRELNPMMLRLACMAAGVQPPSLDDLCYLELGFGQGVSINIHGAASNGAFWGTDFNPSQASHAAGLAGASGAPVYLFDDSFEDFAARSDLPIFDIIVLHGIWSWISERNQDLIVDIIRKSLRVGGIVYISYNCYPGWAAQTPIRHLIAQHIEYAGANITGPIGKIDAALGYVQRVSDSGALYFQSNPSLRQHFELMSNHSRNYLAHEYLNRDWRIHHFADVAERLSKAKLSYVASARLIDHIDDCCLDANARSLLSEIGHPLLRETVRDYVVNQKFRMDVFCKGPRALLGLEARQAWLNERFTLVVPTQNFSFARQTPMGEITLDERIYVPLVDYLASDDYAPKALDAICSSSELANFRYQDILSALLMLVAVACVQPAQEPSVEVAERCHALNLNLCQRALSSGEIMTLASPVLGGGVVVPQQYQMIILARMSGMTTPADQAFYLNQVYESNGVDLFSEGLPVKMGREAITQFTSIAEKFIADGYPPLLAALGVAPANAMARIVSPSLGSRGPALT